jgi:hypothetical protein
MELRVIRPFRSALDVPILLRAYTSRFPGFMEFQTQASSLIGDFLQEKHRPMSTLHALDECFRKWTS